jgi:Ca2+-transporting ATPase
LLSAAAVVSLAPGFSKTSAQPAPQGSPSWIGPKVLLTSPLSIVIAVGSSNDWQKERQCQVLNEKYEDRLVKVIRDHIERQIDVH